MVYSQCSKLQNFLSNTQNSVGYDKIQSKARGIVVELVVFANKTRGLEFEL